MEQLEYKNGDRFSAIPTFEPGIQTITAEKFVKAYDESFTLEGLCFDRNGDLYFTSTHGHAILKVDMRTEKVSIIYYEKGIRPGAVKIHKDGRLFVACNTNEKLGGVMVMDPDGSNAHWILRGYCVNDMVFDSNGGFYFNDFTGTFRNPTGGVYYMEPDYEHITCFCGHMCSPNGIALSTDEKVLWITEMKAQRLHRFDLDYGWGGELSTIPYRFTGYLGPDSCSVDADDNLYVAMPEQGRVMVFNSFGSPIGQVLMPGRELGHNLFTTHPMVRPGTRELYITCRDTSVDLCEGAWIFRAGAFGGGNKKAYQFH